MGQATCFHTIATYWQRPELWSFTSQEEHKLHLFENKAHRKLYALKKGGVSDELRILRNEERHESYCQENHTTEGKMGCTVG
jgi:hypothetical protein